MIQNIIIIQRYRGEGGNVSDLKYVKYAYRNNVVYYVLVEQ